MNFQIGLGTRLNILVISINLIIIGIIAYLASTTSATVLRDDVLTRFTEKSETITTEIDTSLELAEAFAITVANEMSDFDTLTEEATVGQVVFDLYRTGEPGIPLHTINVQRPDGTVINVHPQSRDNASAPFVRVLPGVTTFNTEILSDVAQSDAPLWVIQDTINILVPYGGESGEGVIWIDILLTDFNNKLIESLNFSGLLADTLNGYILVLDDTGQLIDAENIGREIFNAQITTQVLISRINSAEINVNNLYEIPEDPYNNDQPAYASVQTIETNGWGIILVFPEDEVPELSVDIFLPITLVGSIGVLLIVVMVNLFVRNSMVRPLIDLGRSAAEMGEGNLRFIVFHQDKRNEIGRLAQAMDQMRNRLRDSYAELEAFSAKLESRVIERTEQLRDARQQAEQTAQQLQIVYDESLSVVSESQIQPILDTFINRILDLLDASYCSIWLVSDDRQTVELVSTNDSRRRISTGKVTMNISKGLVGQAIRLDQAIIVNDYKHYEHRTILENHYFEDDLPFHRGVCAPLRFAGSNIGAVVVGRGDDSKPFDIEAQRQLILFANMVSPSVRNAQLFTDLQQAMSEVKRANDVKTQFLASVTHELRTPLNLIINNMDFMRTGEFGEVTDDQLKRLNQTVRSAEHLLYLINDLLDVSKIEAGEMQLFIQKQDVYTTLEDAIDNAYAYLETYDEKLENVEIRIDVEDNLPEVPMDERRIYQVLNNLLTNGIKFTRHGAVTLKVFQTDEGIHFVVHDTGMGIPAAEMPKLFAAFERTNAARQQAIEGTGLGLPISQYLIHQHGSEITVSSEVNAGSTFAFTLPYDTPLTVIPTMSETQPIMVIPTITDDE